MNFIWFDLTLKNRDIRDVYILPPKEGLGSNEDCNEEDCYDYNGLGIKYAW